MIKPESKKCMIKNERLKENDGKPFYMEDQSRKEKNRKQKEGII